MKLPIRPEDRVIYNGYGPLRGIVYKKDDGSMTYVPFGNDVGFNYVDTKRGKKITIKKALCWLFGW